MQKEEFEALLTNEGYHEIVTVMREGGQALDAHRHPFEAKALVLAGEIWIRGEQQDRCYRPGDIFHLAANEQHSERYGAQGVTYVVGRKGG